MSPQLQKQDDCITRLQNDKIAELQNRSLRKTWIIKQRPNNRAKAYTFSGFQPVRIQNIPIIFHQISICSSDAET